MGWWHIRQAVRAMHQGGVIAYPTEAVWGLGCDPFNEAAVYRLLAIKRRPVAKGLILVASSVEQIQPLLDNLAPEDRTRVTASWPGPVTWVLPDPDNLIPYWIKGNHASVAVRVSDHYQVKNLCEAFGSMIVSTSANYSNRDAARDKLKVSIHFKDKVDAIVPGELGELSRPTKIYRLDSDQPVRS
ncbi:tRNA threonylcarbamoyladenosine biosynthesis protein RimN [Amphritea opalescens]|uniref:Threonylcarbamoyl-AMP synthase n=1 Tax=Amphritea opalescens TaxID=2490544 RepID=A0A430KQ02_9GAMM|nr:Sua5/YciO/YrdC/YwlC family protein [Amphritea opalescens]RTE65454.1 tRNA threonylcarbamoyladenosine biosynthesis protein RimN [Amphritea opalescens]